MQKAQAEPHRTGKNNCQTEPNRNEDASKITEPKRIEPNRFIPAYVTTRARTAPARYAARHGARELRLRDSSDKPLEAVRCALIGPGLMGT